MIFDRVFRSGFQSSLKIFWIIFLSNHSFPIVVTYLSGSDIVVIYFWSYKMTSSYGIIFRLTGPLCVEFASHRWIPHTKASDVELWCFLWYAPEHNTWANNGDAGDLRRHRDHYDVTLMGNIGVTLQIMAFLVMSIIDVCVAGLMGIIALVAVINDKNDIVYIFFLRNSDYHVSSQPGTSCPIIQPVIFSTRHIDGSAQDCSNSSALAMQLLLQLCAKSRIITRTSAVLPM